MKLRFKLLFSIISLLVISTAHAMDLAVVSVTAPHAEKTSSAPTLEDIVHTIAPEAQQRFRGTLNKLAPLHHTCVTDYADSLFPPELHQDGPLCCDVLELLTGTTTQPIRYISQLFKDIAGASIIRKLDQGFDQFTSEFMGPFGTLPDVAKLRIFSYIPPTKRLNAICSNKGMRFISCWEQNCQGRAIARHVHKIAHIHSESTVHKSILQAGLALLRLLGSGHLAPLPQTQHVIQLLRLIEYSLRQNSVWPLTACNDVFSTGQKLTEKHYLIAANAQHLFTANMNKRDRAYVIAALLKGTFAQIQAIVNIAQLLFTADMNGDMNGWYRAYVIAAALQMPVDQIVAARAQAITAAARTRFIAALLKGTPAQIQAIADNAQHYFLTL